MTKRGITGAALALLFGFLVIAACAVGNEWNMHRHRLKRRQSSGESEERGNE